MTETAVWPPAGAFGLARIRGPVGWLVWAGQALSGDLSKWTHAFFVLDNGDVIEAEPGGAKIRSIERYLRMDEILICDLPVREHVRVHAQKSMRVHTQKTGAVPSEDELRRALVRTARNLERTPYNWLNYPALGLAALGIRPRWLRDFISKRPEMICSQLVDFVYMVNGIHLFDDGRLPQEVTPGDLWKWVRAAQERARKGWKI